MKYNTVIDNPQHQINVVRYSEVVGMTGLSRTTIWRLERAGKFPQRLRLSSNRVGWYQNEVEKWISTRPRGMAG